MAKEIVISWTRQGYSFTIDGVAMDFSVRSAAMKMGPGRVPAVVIEIDADLVRMEHGFNGSPICGEGDVCVLVPGHGGPHELEHLEVEQGQEAVSA